VTQTFNEHINLWKILHINFKAIINSSNFIARNCMKLYTYNSKMIVFILSNENCGLCVQNTSNWGSIWVM